MSKVSEPIGGGGAATEAPRLRLGDWVGLARFSNLETEYNAIKRKVGLHDRSYRRMLEVTGDDRAAWLHNLTTNQVKTLGPGDGNYTYAIDVKGRILFDMNVLVHDASIWLDIDHRWIEAAKQHFAKYAIVEDVSVLDRSGDSRRLALVGPGAPKVMARFGASNVAAVPYLQAGQATIAGTSVTFFRHDLVGGFGIDLVVPQAAFKAVWDAVKDDADVTPVGYQAVDTLRIEAAIPWPINEINHDVLPAETGQLDRAVSFNKGCYLGQEIVERMRSRRSLARKLVLVKFDGEHVPEPRATLRIGDKVIGHVTSACRSPAIGAPIALAYVRTAHAVESTEMQAAWSDKQAGGRVIPIPPLE